MILRKIVGITRLQLIQGKFGKAHKTVNNQIKTTLIHSSKLTRK